MCMVLCYYFIAAKYVVFIVVEVFDVVVVSVVAEVDVVGVHARWLCCGSCSCRYCA